MALLNSDAIGTAELKAREMFYRSHELGKTWFDVAAVNEILDMIPVEVDLAHPVQDRKGMKDMFRQMAPVRNELDGRVVRFPVAAAKKIRYQRDVDIFALAQQLGRLFELSRHAWSETEADIPNHRTHRNIDAYHQYIVKMSCGGELYFVRFAVREDGASAGRNELHDAIVSRIVVYKAKDAELSGLGQTRVEDSAPFVDNKIALFFSIVNGGVDG